MFKSVRVRVRATDAPSAGARSRRAHVPSRLKAVLGVVLALGLVVPVGVTVVAPPEPAEAANASLFDPGFIISDAAFFDSGAMTTAQVQSFLDAKVPTCRATYGPTCLRHYTEDTRAVAAAVEPDTCEALSARTARTAAQIITDVATACGISPRALLVLLEKEQSLVTSTAPALRNYTFATGWGCPDTADCQRLHTGLFNQLYKAAWQFKWYGRGSFTWIELGQSNFVRYHPNAACGGTDVVVKNRATAALYYYTPYQPNAAALSNLYGVGDGCSAYGNRNFWWMYSDWFGSPIGGDSLFTTAGSSITYLVAGDVKYRVGSAPTVADLSMLGSVTTVSQTYLDRFRTAGWMRPFVADPVTDAYYLIDRGRKYPVDTCGTAHRFGFTCGGATKLTTSQLDRMATATALTGRVKSASGNSFHIDAGARREYYDTAAYVASGVPVEKLVYLADRTIAHLPAGVPMVPDLVSVTDGASVTVNVGGAAWRISTALYGELGLAARFGAPRLMQTASIAAMAAGGDFDDFVRSDSTGELFVLTPAGRVPFPHGNPAGATTAADALLQSIPVASGDWSAKFVADLPNGRRYLVHGAEARRIASDADLLAITRAFGLGAPVRFPIDAILAVPNGTYVLAPGTVARSGDGTMWFVDGEAAIRKVDARAADELSARPPAAASAATMDRYSPAADATAIGVACAGTALVANNGVYHPVDPRVVAAYPFGFPAVTAETCAALGKSSATAGRFLRDATSKQLYYVWGGTKRPITGATYWRLRNGTPPNYITVGPSFLAHFRTGSTMTAPKVPVRDTTTEAPPSGEATTIGATCAGAPWVANGDVHHPVDPSVVAAYPFDFPARTTEECAAHTRSAATAGRFLRDASSMQLYYVWGGKKRPISGGTYWRLRNGTPPNYIEVGADFLVRFPTGSPIS